MNNIEHGFGMGYGGWFIPLLILALIYYFFQDKKSNQSSAQDILDRRYANGEIDEKEYNEKSRPLKEQE